MKHIIIAITLALLPIVSTGQAQINTKKVKIGDFTEKVTKVVLSGNDIYDTSLKEEIASVWRISPYEFCSLEEFDSLKDNDNYYFLITVTGQFRKENEPGIKFLTLVKGGGKAAEGIDKMLEVVSIPICSAENSSGREYVFLPTFLNIIQNYTFKAMDKDFHGYGGLGSTVAHLGRTGNKEFVFSEDDLSSEVNRVYRELNFDSDMVVTDEAVADNYIINKEPGKIVSYTVYPDEPVKGSYCYKMFIDSQTNELYYFRKHRITQKYGTGFLPEDIHRINTNRGR